MSVKPLPVGAAQLRKRVCSFGRTLRFRHFNKLTLRDFAKAKGAWPPHPDCAGTEMPIRMFKNDLKEDHHGKSSMEAAGLADRPQGTAQGKSRVQAPRARALDAGGREQAEAARQSNTPTGVMSIKLQRPVAAIRSKAQREGISLRPVNRSPYSRRTKAAKRR
ncbi:hypothetical protein [Bradyrhizobium sp. I71]|uniref:hypothetical protein n=1 Tax=Bradyrhizobium sp. I71 TaxID=2590772 RepID=UPI001EF7AB16|nr:hypothetical protein [Bradyrhizobium sp. I71]